jgi:predicted PurR-regulated permease PerM
MKGTFIKLLVFLVLMKKKRRRSSRKVIIRDGTNKYLFWAIFALLLILSYLVLKPYLIALITAFILAYLVRPLNVRLEKRLSKSVAAIVSVFVTIVILVLPVALVAASLVQQIRVYLLEGGLSKIVREASSSFFGDRFKLEAGALVGVDTPLVDLLASVARFIPSLLIALFITLFGMYYILVNWDALTKTLTRFIPFKNRKEIVKDISEISNIIVYGTLSIALVEFVIAAAGFYLLGIEFYLLLALLAFFLTFIPALGPALVWAPMLIYYLVIGNYYIAIGVAVVGLILSVLVDTILRAKILGDKARINPLVMIVGLLGGIAVFGVFGFIIGPLILLYTIEILKEVSKNK